MSILWYGISACRRHKSSMRCFAYALLFAWIAWGTSCAFAGEPYTGPIIDAHGHLGSSFRAETIISAMDTNNIAKQILMARYYPGPTGAADQPGSDELALELA